MNEWRHAKLSVGGGMRMTSGEYERITVKNANTSISDSTMMARDDDIEQCSWLPLYDKFHELPPCTKDFRATYIPIS